MSGHDAWLHALRSDPSPQFKERLRARLRARDAAPIDAAASGRSDVSLPLDSRRHWPRRTIMAVAATVVATALIAVPGVRASVAQFVSLFRVTHFVAVPVDSSRLDRLEAENLEVGALIGEHVEIVQDPGPAVSVASVDDAAAASGMTLAVPQWLPENTTVMETAVVGERAVRVTANSTRLRQVMDALGITDLTVPAGLDGQVVDVRVPPVVMIRYDHGGKGRTRLFQARAPQLSLPDGINLQALGEIGLRILGLAPAEARQFAAAMDWTTTFVLPVPPTASSFRQVSIGGHRGVLIEYHPRNESPTKMIVWSTADRVFALVSIRETEQALAMAESVR